jgi:hypothetical protein
MTLPIKERVRKYRLKKKAEGSREVHVMIREESVSRLDLLRPRLKKLFKIDKPINGVIIDKALEYLDEFTGARLKNIVLQLTRDLQDQGLSLEEIANNLNLVEYPTISGKGKWDVGTLETLLNE